MSRKIGNAQSRATFFRHSAVLSLPAVLLRKLATDRSQTERSGSIEVKSDGRDISSKYLDIFMTRRNAFIRIRSLPNLRNCSLYSFLLQRKYRDGSRGGFRGYAAPHSPSPTHPEMTCSFLIQLVFCKKKFHQSAKPFLCGAPLPKKNPGSAPGIDMALISDN